METDSPSFLMELIQNVSPIRTAPRCIHHRDQIRYIPQGNIHHRDFLFSPAGHGHLNKGCTREDTLKNRIPSLTPPSIRESASFRKLIYPVIIRCYRLRILIVVDHHATLPTGQSIFPPSSFPGPAAYGQRIPLCFAGQVHRSGNVPGIGYASRHRNSSTGRGPTKWVSFTPDGDS